MTTTTPSDLHRLAELRSIAYHREVAKVLLREGASGPLWHQAHTRLTEWVRTRDYAMSYWKEWQTLLHGPLDRLLERLVADDESARNLRQCTPFAGAISAQERWKLWDTVKETFLNDAR